MLWEQGVEGSNPFAPTWKSRSYRYVTPILLSVLKRALSFSKHKALLFTELQLFQKAF